MSSYSTDPGGVVPLDRVAHVSEPIDPSEPLRDESDHIALVGLMGSGKTSVGEVLARLIGRDLVDTDQLVEANTGTTIAQLFQSEGEAAFRRYEVESLRRALMREEPAVIATGGGIVTSPVARHMLTVNSTVVWLRADPAVLAVRLGDDDTRPLLGERDALEILTGMHETRGPLYSEVSDLVVDAGVGGPEAVAAVILDALGWSR